MDISLEDSITMEAYFNSELNKAEELSFLDKVASNKALQETFEFEKFLRGKSNALVETQVQQPKRPVSLSLAKYLIAACLIGIIAFIALKIYRASDKKNDTIVIQPKKSVSIDSNKQQLQIDSANLIADDNKLKAIYNANYEQYKPTGYEPAELGNVMLAYQQGDYNKAFNDLNEVGITRSSAPQDSLVENYVVFYKALYYAETQQSSNAITIFRQIVASNTSLKVTAQWYLALELLKTKEPEKASFIFKTIASKKNKYSKKANNILQQMNANR